MGSRCPKPATIDPSNIEKAVFGPAPQFISPQLATLNDSAPDGSGWAHEIKFDGYRMQAHIRAGDTIFTSRNGLDWSERFPELAALLGELPVLEAILDGEVVHMLPTGVTSFGALQDDLSRRITDGLIFVAFDLLYLNGYRLTEAPLIVRKQFLEYILQAPPDQRVRYSEHHTGKGIEFFKHAAAVPGLEGIVSKRLDAPYRSSRQSTWLKIKALQREEFVVIGWTNPERSRIGFGALVLGYYSKATGELTYAGGVGNGFNDKLLREMHGRLGAMAIEDPGVRLPKGVKRSSIHWVRSEIVVETRFTEWTRDGILRHPSFLGERLDKKASEVVLGRALSEDAKATRWAKPKR